MRGEALPPGLFAGLFLREMSLEDNPGAPFPLRLPLASLIAAGDGTPCWRASSSDASVATVRVVGDDLLVEPEPGAEGTVAAPLDGAGGLGPLDC